MRSQVTTDWSVARAIEGLTVVATHGKSKKPKLLKPGLLTCFASDTIAQALKLTVFQITARLKGMEGRELVVREDGLWGLTEKGRNLAALIGEPQPIAKPKVARPDGWKPEPPTTPDDSKVKQIKGASKEDGWTWRTQHDPAARRFFTVHMGPDGTEYVEAHVMERADLIVKHDVPGLPASRLRIFAASSKKRAIARVERKEQTEKKQAKVRTKQRRQAKKAHRRRLATLKEERRPDIAPRTKKSSHARPGRHVPRGKGR